MCLVDNIQEGYNSYNYLKDGIKAALIGAPNVGKSSLFNALLNYSRAIVTDIAGTTRDTITESINFNGYIVNFTDTAGIRETDNLVESLGVEKSKELIHKADLVLLVIDGSQPLDEEDQKLLDLTNFQFIFIHQKLPYNLF